MAGQPAMITDPRKEHTKGKQALYANIAAAKAIANIVKTTLGPKGMDKMLVNAVGDIVLTNDGAMILRGMDIENPTANMIVEIARTQEDIAGDGTTSAAVLAGSLLEKAEELIDSGIHPTIIIKGFLQAADKASELLDNYAIDVTKENKEVLLKIAKTAIAGKGAEAYGDLISELCVDAALEVEVDAKVNVNDSILITQDPGQSITETELLEGIVINKARLHSAMPEAVENAKIVLISADIMVQKTKNKSTFQINSADQLTDFLKKEEEDFHKLLDKIIDTGANVVVGTKNIDQNAADYFQKKGIFAIRRINDDNVKSISRATGAHIVKNINDVSEKDLGYAGLVEQIGAFDLGKTYFKDCQGAKTVTLLLRGSTEHVTDNLERTIDDALQVIKNGIEDEKIVAGGGAAEIEVAQGLRAFASTIGGREQLAISAFAEAIESIPKEIAVNAGMDGIDTILSLRAKHGEIKNAGLDVYTGEISDALEKGIVDPLRVKKQAIKSASEVANMVLRVDDMLKSQRREMMDVNPEHNIHNYDALGM
ncbi:thermosome subunit alpha [Methanococcoides methylutens]|uniref:Heat shock protein 60 family chaperone GroEL n=1 Tax=Methanococcoides methylutens MM1 TaxID=1434104 RepID=A0A0E3SSJ1_METMT|nr:thermosome subunit alpha [Methanococcoides methylutens]AKB85528.1 Heat shock protein 60 family chaperone GroEL [Methanococcoides methylutens MM1]